MRIPPPNANQRTPIPVNATIRYIDDDSFKVHDEKELNAALTLLRKVKRMTVSLQSIVDRTDRGDEASKSSGADNEQLVQKKPPVGTVSRRIKLSEAMTLQKSAEIMMVRLKMDVDEMEKVVKETMTEEFRNTLNRLKRLTEEVEQIDREEEEAKNEAIRALEVRESETGSASSVPFNIESNEKETKETALERQGKTATRDPAPAEDPETLSNASPQRSSSESRCSRQSKKSFQDESSNRSRASSFTRGESSCKSRGSASSHSKASGELKPTESVKSSVNNQKDDETKSISRSGTDHSKSSESLNSHDDCTKSVKSKSQTSLELNRSMYSERSWLSSVKVDKILERRFSESSVSNQSLSSGEEAPIISPEDRTITDISERTSGISERTLRPVQTEELESSVYSILKINSYTTETQSKIFDNFDRYAAIEEVTNDRWKFSDLPTVIKVREEKSRRPRQLGVGVQDPPEDDARLDRRKIPSTMSVKTVLPNHNKRKTSISARSVQSNLTRRTASMLRKLLIGTKRMAKKKKAEEQSFKEPANVPTVNVDRASSDISERDFTSPLGLSNDFHKKPPSALDEKEQNRSNSAVNPLHKQNSKQAGALLEKGDESSLSESAEKYFFNSRKEENCEVSPKSQPRSSSKRFGEKRSEEKKKATSKLIRERMLSESSISSTKESIEPTTEPISKSEATPAAKPTTKPTTKLVSKKPAATQVAKPIIKLIEKVEKESKKKLQKNAKTKGKKSMKKKKIDSDIELDENDLDLPFEKSRRKVTSKKEEIESAMDSDQDELALSLQNSLTIDEYPMGFEISFDEASHVRGKFDDVSQKSAKSNKNNSKQTVEMSDDNGEIDSVPTQLRMYVDPERTRPMTRNGRDDDSDSVPTLMRIYIDPQREHSKPRRKKHSNLVSDQKRSKDIAMINIFDQTL